MINNYDSVVSCNSSGTPHSQRQESASYTLAKRTWVSFVTVLIALFSIAFVNATTCPNATTITPASLPITNQTIVCGTTNDITSSSVATSALTGGCSNSSYYGGFESLYSFTPTATGLYLSLIHI